MDASIAQARLLVVFTLSALLATPVAAQEPAPQPDTEINLFQLEQTLSSIVVKSASKLTQPVSDAPAVMSVVSREEAQQYGWLSLNDMLYRQPGFSPGQDFERSTVNFRGLFDSWNNNHLLVLIDGVPQNDNLYGTAYTWDVTPLFLVRNVEITRGPGSALYGSNATNGVIAINSRSPADLAGNVEAQLRLGSNGMRIYDLVVGHAWKPISVLAGYNRLETDGNSYSAPDGSDRKDATGGLTRFNVTDARKSDYGFLKIEAHRALEGLSLQLHIQNWSFRNGFGWDEFVTDVPDRLSENREVLSLSYRPRAIGNVTQEYVLLWQRHAIDWNAEYYPANYMGGYPNGGYEDLVTEGNTIFARAQVGYRIWHDIRLIGGVEENLFIYSGDHTHTANFNVNDSAGGYPPLPAYEKLGPWLEWILNKPVSNLGVFLQLSTGKLFREHFEATLGARYDLMSFDYTDLNDPALPTRHRDYQQFSPRLALLFFPHRRVTIKLLGDRAFRAPSPAELFGANTFTVASDLMQAQPEQLTTAQVAIDFSPLDYLTLRANGYYERFDNQTGYSVISSSRQTAGLEAELLVDRRIKQLGRIAGFANYSYAALLAESINAGSGDQPTPNATLTWVPSQLANLGVRFAGHGFYGSAQVHYQGQVLRRAGDRMTADFIPYRPDVVPAWATLDARFAVDVFDWLRLGIQATNLTNTHGTYIKANDFPYDYQIQGARVLGTLEATLR